MYNRRKSGMNAHEWDIGSIDEVGDLEIHFDIVGSIMSTDLITVMENDLAELVLKVMDWRDIRHLPDEDSRGNLKGIITKKRLIRYLEDEKNDPLSTAVDVMDKNPITIGPNDDLKYAMLLMMDKGISCLPVVAKNQLIGIITDKDTQVVWEKIKKRNVTGN